MPPRDGQDDEAGKSRPGTTSPSRSITTIDAAIAHCANHCNHPVPSPGFIPSRLLFVGSYDDDDKVRVMTRAEFRKSTTANGKCDKYAALSYCWGPPGDALAQCKTTRNSLPARLKHVPGSELSPVVRDAVAVARRLGIPYLWIDSLCIVQDDVADWEAESGLMGAIYSNAYVTIVGLNSASCRVGFLAGRADWPYLSTRSTSTTATNNKEEMEEDVNEKEEGYDDTNTWQFAAALNKARWSTRGWTFQEKSLSTRLLYFDSANVHLRCANYTFRDGRAGPVLGKQPSIFEHYGHSEEETALSVTESWRNVLVPRFAGCLFSVATDKLPAIAGIAKHFGDVTGYEYAAGLWVPCLERDLAWSCAPQHLCLEDLLDALDPLEERYIAPSWSWARAPGPMERLAFLDIPSSTTAHQSLEVVAEFIKADVGLVGSNPYGRVSGGKLVVVSKIMPLVAVEYGKVIQNNDEESWFELDWIVKDDELEKLPAGLEMVTIGSYTDWHGDGKGRRKVYGIVVHPVGRLPGKYYRVGLFNCCHVDGDSWLGFESMTLRMIEII
ncbi:heterokaryon incompatibility protein-domain-containing protein [Apodospora peruviana]|uniref:Heterokaryon incompatibility protein-domain-containing protein n=1 Tax=Apodospora peruviana TaxID=516989 RepID=A0AAE0I4L1_9PEZI|nr:heterokaryon incompatibility protein-domain-containing protein [Apodospora peruviana]